jgi:hypothetical protein
MKTKELLEKNPLSTEVIRTWFFNQMIASLSDETVPEEFKEMMKQEGVTNERMATFIDVQPRTLFDVFDENNILIEIFRPLNEGSIYPSNYFSYKIGNISPDIKKTRKEAEHSAIEEAFEILENKLTPAVQEIDVVGEEIVEE